MKTLEGRPRGDGRHIGIVVSRFNLTITSRLLAGALEALRAHGVADEHVTVAYVPGAFELPLAAQRMARRGDLQAVICLGAVIRGETPHFEYVSAEAAGGIASVARECGVPVIFGVLTADTMEQALARAGGAAGNKGRDAALAGLEMADLLERLA